MTFDRASRLSSEELEACCIGPGSACVHCGRPMPDTEDAPRPCPAVADEETAERIREKASGGPAGPDPDPDPGADNGGNGNGRVLL